MHLMVPSAYRIFIMLVVSMALG